MKDYVKETASGRLYIETEDFFKQPKVIETIKSLKDSKIVKQIKKRNNKILLP